MGMTKIKKEELVWKVIRDVDGDYYLVEASLPIGTSKYEDTWCHGCKDKMRVSRAEINYITKISNLDRNALYGKIPKKITIFENKTVDKVKHFPVASGAKQITYKVGKLLQPDGFDNDHYQCGRGLHFFRAKDFPKKVAWK